MTSFARRPIPSPRPTWTQARSPISPPPAARPVDGVLTPATASATANAQGLPAWTLAKTVVAGDPYDAVGDLVDYRYVVTNTGNVRIDAIAIADDHIATVSCPVTTVAPGDSATCTALYTVTQADLDAGTVTNHATATGTPTLGILPPATANATVTATGLPALSLDKQAVSGNRTDAPGDRVDYEYRVTNTGNVRIHTLSVTDDRIASIACPATILAPGDSTTCSGTYTITQADLNAGLVTNHANATGTPTLGTLAPVTDTETVVSSATAALRVEKVVVSGAPYDAVGDVVAYEYRVSTPNGVQIRSITVTDDRIASVSCPDTVVEGVMVMLCTGTYTITQADLDAGSVTNIVTVDGVADSGPVVPDTDTATVVATVNAAMTLAKSAVAGAPYDAVGDTVAYEYRRDQHRQRHHRRVAHRRRPHRGRAMPGDRPCPRAPAPRAPRPTRSRRPISTRVRSPTSPRRPAVRRRWRP
jgi:hypothetical protein